MKNLTLIYCGEDSESVKALEAELCGPDSDVSLCSTEYFVGAEIVADRVIIMPDVPFFRAMPIKAAYPNAEYSPPDEFAPKQVNAALRMFDSADAGEINRYVKIGDEVFPADLSGNPKRKRGRPRKVAA